MVQCLFKTIPNTAASRTNQRLDSAGTYRMVAIRVPAQSFYWNHPDAC